MVEVALVHDHRRGRASGNEEKTHQSDQGPPSSGIRSAIDTDDDTAFKRKECTKPYANIDERIVTNFCNRTTEPFIALHIDEEWILIVFHNIMHHK
jgi:hypothetical protein